MLHASEERHLVLKALEISIDVACMKDTPKHFDQTMHAKLGFSHLLGIYIRKYRLGRLIVAILNCALKGCLTASESRFNSSSKAALAAAAAASDSCSQHRRSLQSVAVWLYTAKGSKQCSAGKLLFTEAIAWRISCNGSGVPFLPAPGRDGARLWHCCRPSEAIEEACTHNSALILKKIFSDLQFCGCATDTLPI